jgi:hypothetical protein
MNVVPRVVAFPALMQPCRRRVFSSEKIARACSGLVNTLQHLANLVRLPSREILYTARIAPLAGAQDRGRVRCNQERRSIGRSSQRVALVLVARPVLRAISECPVPAVVRPARHAPAAEYPGRIIDIPRARSVRAAPPGKRPRPSVVVDHAVRLLVPATRLNPDESVVMHKQRA